MKISDENNMTFTYFLSKIGEKGKPILTGHLIVKGNEIDRTHQVRLCLEIGLKDEAAEDNREQIMFTGSAKDGKFTEVIVAKKPGMGLNVFSIWCATKP